MRSICNKNIDKKGNFLSIFSPFENFGLKAKQKPQVNRTAAFNYIHSYIPSSIIFPIAATTFALSSL